MTSHTLTTTLRAACMLPLATAVLAMAAEPARAASRWATLEAIHSLENPTDRTTPGPCGELGPYQFREATWRRYSDLPFIYAIDRRASDAVAVRHYERIKQDLANAGVPATTYAIALVWNGGMGAALRGRRAPRAARDYAERASNLAAALDGAAVASR